MRAELRGIDVAQAMGYSHQRVYQLEQMRRVRPEIAARYLKALEDAKADADRERERVG